MGGGRYNVGDAQRHVEARCSSIGSPPTAYRMTTGDNPALLAGDA
jgi:hypothetical protein